MSYEFQYVYIATREIDYEGTTIEAVYETEEEALKHPLPRIGTIEIRKFPIMRQTPIRSRGE